MKGGKKTLSKFVSVLAAVCAIYFGEAGCGRKMESSLAKRAGGDPTRGKTAMRRYGCGACHTIPGVDGANGKVGPSLEGAGTRAYIAGVLPNVPEYMVRWIQHPQSVDWRKAMPEMGVTDSDARDMAAYLYTLSERTPIR